MKSLAFALVVLPFACAAPSQSRQLIDDHVAVDANSGADRSPAMTGQLPWWQSVTPGVYRLEASRVVLSVGASREHHHLAEGYLHAKVSARLAVTRAAASVISGDPQPEPRLEDLFIDSAVNGETRRILALYAVDVPDDVTIEGTITDLSPPRDSGRHMIGEHTFEGGRHLFLECAVEGPLANPDWGRTRAAARN